MVGVRALILVQIVALLSACSSSYKAPIADRSIKPSSYHRVVKGETVFSISWTYGLDYRELSSWNGLGPSYLIHPGQTLRLTPGNNNRTVKSVSIKPVRRISKPRRANNPVTPTRPSSRANKATHGKKPIRPASVPVLHWMWPTLGKVIHGFSKNDAGKKGIAISGRSGQRVIASAAGKVVYSGEGLLRYGKLIIIKHDDTYFSAYAHNRRLLVKEGSMVKQGQQIAEMGRTGTDQTMLHFEIRKDGKPINPLYFLPKQ